MRERQAAVRRPLTAGLAHAPLVDGDHPEAGLDEQRGEEPKLRAKIEHGRRGHDQRALAGIVVGKLAVGQLKELSCAHRGLPPREG